MRFLQADTLHRVAARARGERLEFTHDELRQFSLLVGEFIRELGDQSREDPWADVVRVLRRARWDAVTIPLPLASDAVGLGWAAARAIPALQRCPVVTPRLSGLACRVSESLETVVNSPDDPVGDAVRSVLEIVALPDTPGEADEDPEGVGSPGFGGWDDGRVPRLGVLLISQRAAQATRAGFLSGEPVQIISPSEAAQKAAFDSVVAVGAAGWFKPSVLRAPRGYHFVFIQPNWFPDRDIDLGLLGGAVSPARVVIPAPSPAIGGQIRDDLAPPPADWNAIAAFAGRGLPSGVGHEESVMARLFLLASEEAVYLEVSDTSRITVLEVDEDQHLAIHQEVTSRISNGHFVVLRAGGDRDYVRQVADTLLGPRAGELRALQREWKEKLAARCECLGIVALTEALQAAGSALGGDDANVRRWMGPDSIKTQDPRDFRAILVVIGEEGRLPEFWGGMEKIASAHSEAGIKVRQRLIEQIRRGDASLLLNRGWCDYEVPEIDGEGFLRVARVEACSPDAEPVPPARTRQLIKVERDLWPE